MRILVGALIILHGLVHLMYVGQALRWFELRAGMEWPIGARFLPSRLSDVRLREFAAVTVGTTSLALVVGGVGILLDSEWAPWLTIASATLVSFLHVLLWNGDRKTSPDQGLYGIIINAIIVVWVLVAR